MGVSLIGKNLAKGVEKMANYIEIKMTKCKLYLTETELQYLLSKDKHLWQKALKRGKFIKRSENCRPGKVLK